MKLTRIVAALVLAAIMCMSLVVCGCNKQPETSSVVSKYSIPSVPVTSSVPKSTNWKVSYKYDPDTWIITEMAENVFSAILWTDSSYSLVMNYVGEYTGTFAEREAADKEAVKNRFQIEYFNGDIPSTETEVGGYSAHKYSYEYTLFQGSKTLVSVTLIDVAGELYTITQSTTVSSATQSLDLVNSIIESIEFVSVAG